MLPRTGGLEGNHTDGRRADFVGCYQLRYSDIEALEASTITSTVDISPPGRSNASQ